MSGTRRSIEVAGLSHGNLPIPTASRVGPFIATGGIRGVDRRSGVMPPDVADQVRHMFSNLQAIVEAAGADCASILKLTIWIKTQEARPLINEEWVKMFPDPHARPARHILNYELGGAMLVQCEALAVAAT
ncbi:MAG TPA: RidA family protein [Rhizomicrobium sp.]